MRSVIPNPFDSSSRLVDLQQQAQVIQEGAQLFGVLRNLVGILLFGGVLFYVGVPIEIVLLVVSGGVASTLIMGFFNATAIKKISSQNTADIDSYRQIILTSEYYTFVRAITGFFLNFIAVSAAFFLFFDEITQIPIQNLPLEPTSLPYLLWFMVLFNLLEILPSYLRYSWMKQLPQGPAAEVQRAFGLVQKKISFVKSIPSAVIIIAAFALFSVPWFITAGITLVIIIMSVLSWVEITRITKADVSSEIDKSIIEHEIKPIQGEQVAGAVFGVMKVATGFRDLFQVTGKEVLGSGKSNIPENSIVITNCRILFIQVPLSGGNTIADGVNYAEKNFFYNRGELREKGKQLINQAPITDIFNLGIREAKYADITTATLKKNKIVITRKDGSKIGYAWMDQEIYQELARLLAYYLKERVIIK